MFPLPITMNIQAWLFVFVMSLAYGQDRMLKSQLNPGCGNCTEAQTLIYVQARGSNDTIHQFWDFTRGTPTVIFTLGTANSSMMAVWSGQVPVDFQMSERPCYSFAAAIDKLIEYNDVKDIGHLDNSSSRRVFSLRHVVWKRQDLSLTEEEAMVTLHGAYQDREWGTGIVEMKLDLLPFRDYAVDLPHLIHSANSTLVSVGLVNVTCSRDYNSSRLALRLVLVSTDPAEESMTYDVRKSLDDEHTPGVFEIMEIRSPASAGHGEGGFLQFRPVGYTQPERGVTSSVMAHVSNLDRTSIPSRSTLKTYYKFFDEGNLLVQDVTVSFGESGDGFYRKHNYTSWSYTIGYGAPPIETFSLFVIMIISIGLGVPVVLALSGVTYVVMKRCKQRNTPTRFTDDE